MSVSYKRASGTFLFLLSLVLPAMSMAGDPIPGIDITVNQSPGGVIGSGTTNAAGEFTIHNLDAGDYLITLSGNGHSIVVGQNQDDRITIRNTREAVRPVRVELSQYQDGEDIVLRKRPGRTTFNPVSASGAAAVNRTEQAATEGRRVVVLKSNKQGDPDANRYDVANNDMDQDCDSDTSPEACSRALDDDSDGDSIPDGSSQTAAAVGYVDDDSDDDGLETAVALAGSGEATSVDDDCSGVVLVSTTKDSLTVSLSCDDRR